MQPGDARELARKESSLIDHKGDTLTVLAERKQKKIAVQAVVGVPTVRAFLFGRYSTHMETHAKTAARQIQMIAHAFPKLLDKTLDSVTASELEDWRSGELKAGHKPATCNSKLSALRGLFSRAIEFDVLLTPSPLAKIKKQREKSHHVRYLASDERTRLAKALDDHEAAVRAECSANARNKKTHNRCFITWRFCRLPQPRRNHGAQYRHASN
jgi:integrase